MTDWRPFYPRPPPTSQIKDTTTEHLRELAGSSGYGIGSSALSLGRMCWSAAFNNIVVAA